MEQAMNSADGKARLVRLFPALSEADARITLSVYRLLAGNDDVHAASIAAASGEPEAHVRYLLNEWPGVFRGSGGEIVGFWGLARPEMDYEFHVGGRRRYAWCAWDTLFIPELVDTEARVEATTGIEQSPVRLVVSPSAVAIEAGDLSEL